MKKIEFFIPEDGDLIENPDLALLEKLFLTEDENFWCSGAGMSYIDYFDEKSKTRMEIMFDKLSGFYLRYKALHEDYHTIGKGDFEHIIVSYTGGNPINLPSIFFIEKLNAFQVIKYFLDKGERYEGVSWLNDDNLEWDYGVV